MEIEKKTIKLCGGLCTASFKADADSDIIVPDTKPDVLKIIGAAATLVIKEKYAQKGKVTLSGVVYYRIIYEGENDTMAARSIEYTAPFSHQHEIACIDDNSEFYALPVSSSVKTTVVNSRKISVHSVFDIKVSSACADEKTLVTSLDDSMPSRSKTIKYTNKVISKEEDIELSEMIDFPNNAADILAVNATVNRNDIKVVNNKIVVKGEVVLKIVYITTDNVIDEFNYNSEFSDVLDVLGIQPEMMTNVVLAVKECNAKLAENMGGEAVPLTVKIVAAAYIDAYESAEETGIYDAYSPEMNIETTYEDIGYLTLLADETKQSNVSDFLETNGAVENIFDTRAVCTVRSQNYNAEGDITIEAVISASVICSENGRLSTVKKDIPVTFKFDAQKGLADIQIVPYLPVSGISYAQKGERQIELKIPVMCEVLVFAKSSDKLLSDVSTENAAKIDKTNQPSLIIYFVKEGDTLWNIAKKYNVLVEDIARINGIENENVIMPGDKLIIPKKR